MRITHIIPALTKGGGERVMVTLANAAADVGHAVTVVAAFPVAPELLQDDLRDSITLRFVNATGRPKLKRYVNLLPWVLRNWAWLRRQDVVHCHLTFGAVLGSAIRAVRKVAGSRRPLVIETFHAVGMPIKPW